MTQKALGGREAGTGGSNHANKICLTEGPTLAKHYRMRTRLFCFPLSPYIYMMCNKLLQDSGDEPTRGETATALELDPVRIVLCVWGCV